jgi:hypothetical protein
MIHKTDSSRPNHTRVTFELPATIWATRIVVVVEGPQQPPLTTALAQDQDGAWRTQLDLPSDQPYHFHYLVDGEWRTDPHADGFAATAHGAYHSLIVPLRFLAN